MTNIYPKVHKYMTLAGLLICVVLAFSASSQTTDVQKLINDLGNPDAEVRMDAATALADLGAQAAPAVSALAKALKDKDAYVRNFSAQALAEIGPASIKALQALIQAMDDKDQAVSQSAQRAIGTIGPSAKAAVPKLAQALKVWPSSAKSSPAAFSLIQIGEPSVPALAKFLEEEETQVVLSGLWCLSEIKSTSHAKMKALAVALGHHNPKICETAAGILRKMGAPAVPTLMNGLASSDAFVRKQSAWALGRMGTAAKKALPTLRAMGKKDKNPDVRAAVNWSVEVLEGKREVDE